MKALKPSHREKKRYVLLEGKNLEENVSLAILKFVGELGMAEISPRWISENVLSVNREGLNKLRASLALFPEEIKIVRVSGTIKGLSQKR